MSRTRTPRQWREILDAFDRSDLSQAAFCRRRGLALATFRYHRARATAPPVVLEAPQLVELFAEPTSKLAPKPFASNFTSPWDPPPSTAIPS